MGNIYSYIFGDQEEEAEWNRVVEVFKTQGLGQVQKVNELTVYETDYFLKLLNFIIIEVKRRTKDERQELITKRRGYFESKNWAEYQHFVQEIMDLEESICYIVLGDLAERGINVSEETFAETYESLQQVPTNARRLYFARQGYLEAALNPEENGL